VQSPWIEEIVSGRKTVEGRGGPRSRFEYMIGNTVEFHNNEISARRLVTDVRHYDSLDEYLDAEWQRAAPQYQSKEAAKDAYLAIRAKDGRQVFGVLPQGVNAIVLG
jgi:ASC-1-like (ASCH) protein